MAEAAGGDQSAEQLEEAMEEGTLDPGAEGAEATKSLQPNYKVEVCISSMVFQ